MIMRYIFVILLIPILMVVSCNKKDEIKPCVCCPVINWDLAIENNTDINQDLLVVRTICFVDPVYPRAGMSPTQVEVVANATFNGNFKSIGGFDYLLNLYSPQGQIKKNFSVDDGEKVNFVIEVDSLENYSLLQKF